MVFELLKLREASSDGSYARGNNDVRGDTAETPLRQLWLPRHSVSPRPIRRGQFAARPVFRQRLLGRRQRLLGRQHAAI